MAVRVKVDSNLLKVKIRKLLRKTKKTEKEFVREQASLMAETIARATPPFLTYRPFRGSMGTLNDFKKGRSAVLHDLNKVFSIRSDRYIAFLIKRFGRENDVKGKLRGNRGEYSVDSPLVTLNLNKAKKFYESKRLANGRPSKGSQADSWAKAFVSKKVFDQIVKDKIDNLGIAKASFAKAVLKLNPKKKANKWIKKHFSRVNTSVIENSTKGYKITINASAKGLQYVTNKINYFAKKRIIIAEKRLKHQYRKTIRKSGFKR